MPVSTPSSISADIGVRLLFRWGRRGNMPDADGFNRIYSSIWAIEWNDPCGIAVGPDGLVYVTDRRNARVLKFTPNGESREKYGSLSFPWRSPLRRATGSRLPCCVGVPACHSR